MPKFSIIIPVYNVVPYLRECLDSVLAQTYADWEAICVDDGSSDGSGAILDEYAARDPRFRVIHQKNTGVSAARNAALEIASGSWISFLDGDDLIDVNMLDLFSKEILDNQELDLVRFSVNGYGRADNLYGCLFVQYAYRKSLVNDLRFKRFVHGEDLLFMSEAILRAKKISDRSDLVLYFYRQREGSAINRKPTWQIIKDECLYRFCVYCLFVKYLRTPPKSYWHNQLRFYVRVLPRMIKEAIK